MTITILKYFFSIILIPFVIFAENNDISAKVKIDSIAVKGNNITDNKIILNELNFTKGDSIDYGRIKYYRERIFSLGLFSSVELKIENTGNGNILLINVEESWYWYPYPYFAMKDGDIKKISVGMDLQVKNFNGWNETIKAKVLLGYDPGFSFMYVAPSVDEDGKYYLAFQTGYSKIANKNNAALRQLNNENFKQDFYYFYAVLGKRLNIFSRLNLQLGYEYIKSPFYKDFINLSGTRIDKIPLVGLDFSYDTRDLSQFPREGILSDISLFEKGFGLNGINYKIFTIDYRQFIPFGDLITKYRLFTRDVFGKQIPLYDYSYLGYGERIRGYYNLEEEGRYLCKASLELSYPIIKQFYINLDFIPVIPNSLLRYRVGLYAQLFGETGTVMNDKEELAVKKFNNGFGCGLTFLILPYNIIRTEIAFNEQFKSQLVFEIGISF